MDTNQIITILKNDILAKDVFKGVYAVDQLPKNLEYGAYVINTDEHYKPGEHWVAVYYDEKSKDYFDSYGILPIDSRIEKFCGKEFVYNNVKLQKTYSNACGFYCIYFILKRVRGIDMENIVYYLNRITDSDYFVKNFIYKQYKYLFY